MTSDDQAFLASRLDTVTDDNEMPRADANSRGLSNHEEVVTVNDRTTIYQELLKSKRLTIAASGFDVDPALINSRLFGFQKAIVVWALRKGRSAVFASTGLGKTLIQVEIARLIGKRALIIAPLTVARQTVKIARDMLGVDVHYTRSSGDLSDGINITNYEMIEHFDASKFDAVLLDESSILKSLDGKTRLTLSFMFATTPYRYCFTATPAPNDITEIGRHAEFLGVMSNAEMLAAFFINDMKQKDGTYRLKRHAVKKFYEWLASWAVAVVKPSDIGYDDTGYDLPPLTVDTVTVDADYTPEGMLPGFNVGGISAIEAKKVRHETLDARVAKVVELVSAPGQWIVWTGLNDEADTLHRLLPDSVNVHGSMEPDAKIEALQAWQDGQVRVLITKTSIAGFGINMQNAHQMVFCGMDYSWEAYFQAVRRCWRFGQTESVTVKVVMSQQEMPIFDRVLEKETEATTMTRELVKHAADYVKRELVGDARDDYQYKEAEAEGHHWRLLLGDSCERMAEIPDNSVDLSIQSPPFISLYTYSPTERDMGNSRNPEQFFAQYRLIIDELLRVTKPGRNCCVHVQQVAATKTNDGYIGIKDFRGDVIRAFIDAGWIHHGEVTIDKNPQVQAIRTKTKGLMFVQLHKDSIASRPAFGDYLLIFQKPGINAVPVKPEVTNEEWIQWAHPVWYDISETKVLNVAVARSEEDERHMCPLQLPLIERCVRLWSNRGEVVFSPFAGIGSELYEAVRLGRRGLGIELKEDYWRVAQRNLTEAAHQNSERSLFDLLPSAEAVSE